VADRLSVECRRGRTFGPLGAAVRGLRCVPRGEPGQGQGSGRVGGGVRVRIMVKVSVRIKVNFRM